MVAAWAMKIQVSEFENPAPQTRIDLNTEAKSKCLLSRFLDHLTFLTWKKGKSESIPNHIGIGMFLMMVLISLIWPGPVLHGIMALNSRIEIKQLLAQKVRSLPKKSLLKVSLPKKSPRKPTF